jgi:LPXTG-site transpeptidase (sortase) family protein
MQQKLKKRSKSSIILIILIIIFITGGIVLISYPILTSIPSIFKKSSDIASWQSMKDNLDAENQSVQDGSSANTIEGQTNNQIDDTNITSQTSIDDQADQQTELSDQKQYYTSTTLSTETTAGNESDEIVKITAAEIFPAKITIPIIDTEWIVNEGSDIPTLKKGPGHIPETPLPGEIGRCTISGHRTTYGAPFNRIDELEYGDLIYIETLNNLSFIYRVTDIEIVKPDYVEILNGTQKKELLLTTCYPEYSARERLVVIAELVNIFPFDINLK